MTNTETETILVPNNKINNLEENKNSKNSIFIGDNLQILKHLRKSYNNKIKMIYIDPPYNTGNNDFVYNDTFKWNEKDLKEKLNLTDNEIKQIKNLEGKSSHSAWLSFMYPRLKLAKDLLTDDGVIFISIDDNEMANLKLLCDEIFGESNFISQIIWKNHNSPSCNTTGKKMINIQCEYILMYSKKNDLIDIQSRELTIQELEDRKYILKDSYFEERGFYTLTPLSRKSTSGAFQYVKSLDYEIEAPDGTFFKNPVNKVIKENGCYTWGKETFDVGNKLGFIEIKKNNDGDWVAYRKIYSKVYFDPKKKIIIKQNQNEEYKNVIEISSSNGTKDISELFDGNSKIFSFSKPVELIKYLINISIQKNTNSNDIILDFFAGSGTTAQAVMELNKEDGGNRKFILCQLDEEIKNNEVAIKFCKDNNLEPLISNICIERVRRASNKLKKEIEEENNIFDNKSIDLGFKVYECKDLEIKTINNIINFDINKEELFDSYDMITPFKYEYLNSSGIDTLLTTFLFNDGFNGENKINIIKFANIEAYNIENKLYIFHWVSEATKELLNKIGLNQLKINEIVVYMYNIDSITFIELKNNLKTVLDENSIKLIERY